MDEHDLTDHDGEAEALRKENARLRAELASGSFYKEADIDALMARAEAAEAALAANRAPDPVVNAGGGQPGDLLPCPFCGHQASADGYIKYGHPLPDTWWDDGSEITEAFFCNCPSCGIRNVVGQIGYQNRDDAIAAWNRRALPAAPVADAQPTIDGAELDALVAALRSGEQADMDGCMVKVSRQACEEAASAITALRAQPDWKAMAEPDYCYNPEDWEYTQPWDARHELAESVLDYGRDNEPARVSTLISGPDKWVARVPLDTDGDGEADDWEDRWFDSEEAARAALSDLAKMKDSTK